MRYVRRSSLSLSVFATLSCATAFAQSTTTSTTQSPAVSKGPSSLSIYFDTGSSAIRPVENKVLDQASRLYNDGKPIVMIVKGMSDTTGPAEANLLLSQSRADAVLVALISRGIPADRFQVLATGETEPAVATAQGVAEQRNRSVEITWR
jgi:outer membrane protein OmpA-like peptidoglycan-associated protein